MRKALTLLSLIGLIALFSCTKPSGNTVTRRFEVPGSYYKLMISDGMTVHVSDQVDDIVITGDENIMEKVRVELSNGTLRIYRKDFSLMYLTTTEVLLPFQENLHNIDIDLDSKFITDFGIEGDEIKLKVNQRSEFSGYIYANNLNVSVLSDSEASISLDVYNRFDLTVKESSEVDLDGYARDVDLTMNENSSTHQRWNGNYYAFSCETVYGTMNDNCKAYIDCEEEIAVDLTNNCFLYFTSWPYIDYDGVDETSDILDRN